MARGAVRELARHASERIHDAAREPFELFEFQAYAAYHPNGRGNEVDSARLPGQRDESVES